ncbi:polyprenyl synthetase family protein [Kitasatospora camelliae]|uniref:Polyprenyl synthetase family protein n=1 Tax=Kitasatospora camelliae TaxID=3156397 RepID=A0AAU8K577_9ACTN
MTEHLHRTALTRPTALESMERCRELVDPALRRTVHGLHRDVRDVAAYAFGWCDLDGTARAAGGGKGLRPALALLTAEAVGGRPEAAVPGAVAVELVHVFSLLHDDIMDGDEQRRHRETAWKAFGVGRALLAGDALLALALAALTENVGHLPPNAVTAATALLADTLVELVNGQAADAAFELRPWTGPRAVTVHEYTGMAAGKTGALLGCAAGLGALLAGAPAPTVAAMTRMGRDLGTAFQAVDDLLGIWGDPAVTGKPVFNDLRRRKKTLPLIHALSAGALGQEIAELLDRPLDTADAEWTLHRTAALIRKADGDTQTAAQARRDLDRAVAALGTVTTHPGAASDLVALAEFVADRRH